MFDILFVIEKAQQLKNPRKSFEVKLENVEKPIGNTKAKNQKAIFWGILRSIFSTQHQIPIVK
jgi:hypothetical protein